ncbi:hypothetical protein Asulf_00403 [Archaeoglobus sulfaticallidus PM70-1]|uniref:Dinitrogenase iron-molybdenum cofactor biosynthesis domain-containing protein n=1 Tax=Archaeoglobus sulfaticallidus PM70-1 TaxID=387631 RepID=N0BJW9_9EURY|nr:NifB/NifX family molybdenum-iron cluster-binding protein [Archaeoglobus sulfaticallidus]AGK60430.1 hypothetical protein Asulf_00403 [Archaeoglobus sulfaticallidus PM70-1]
MKIAATTSKGGLEDNVTPQFGRTEKFTIVDFDKEMKEIKAVEVVDNKAKSQPSGAGIAASQLIIDLGVEILLTGKIGPKAMKVLKSAGVKVYNAEGMNVKYAVDAFTKGELEEIKTGSMGPKQGKAGRGGRGGKGRSGGWN